MKITMMANMDMVLLARWMHFKTVHVNTSWMTTADETGAGNNHAFIILPKYDQHIIRFMIMPSIMTVRYYSNDSILNATGNGYIKESDYVKLLENHGFQVTIYKVNLKSYLFFFGRLTVQKQSR